MNLNTIFFLVKEGFINMWGSKKTAISSLVIIIATMVMLGIFVLITVNIENIIKNAEEAQGIQVFLYDINGDDALVEEKVNVIQEKILDIYSVESVKYTSKEEGLKNVIESVDEQYKSLYEGFENDNPIPASFVVKLENLEQSQNVQNQLEKIEGVKSVISSDVATEAIVSIGSTINIVGILILVILLVISVFIIANTIRITMIARNKEITIMKYVGATDGFIRLPFIIEGMVIGLLGSIIATIIVGLSYNGIYNSYAENIKITGSIIDNALVQFSAVSQELMIIYIVLGVGIGIVGSTISIKKHLNV